MSNATVLKAAMGEQLRTLKMPGIARELEALVREGKAHGWSYEEFLHELLSAEIASRQANMVRQRLREAHFPETKALESFDFSQAEGIDQDQVVRLARGEWVDHAEVVILAGPIGTGKTHLAIALGIEVCKRGKRVVFVRAADLVRQLTEARDQRELGRVTRRLNKADLLIVDELGFVPFDRVGGELLFNVLADRYERRATIITTNLAFGEWVKVFGDEKLTTALLDRLAHHSHIITPRGQSHRLRKRQAAEPQA